METERKRQLSVYLQNKPGELFRMCKALDEEGVNILALTVADTVDHAVDRLIVDDPETAVDALRRKEFLVVENDVLAITIGGHPGVLSELSDLFEHHDINIDYAYCTTHPGQESGYMILNPTDIDEAEEILEQENLSRAG